VRVGWKRYQYCPAGRHWATATRLEWAATVPTDADLAQAALVHDVRIP